MPCHFPEHHGFGNRTGSGPLVYLVTAAVVVYVIVRLVLIVVAFIEVWWWTFPLTAAVVAAGWLLVRRAGRHLPVPPWLRHVPRAVWAAARWHHLSRNLGLAYPDKHLRGKVRRPRAFIVPGRHGIVARVRTVPGTGRAEFATAAEDIANAWRCVRVSVTQRALGCRVVVRGVRRDPLTVPLPGSVLPVFDGRRVLLGRDEWGALRHADLANLSGSAFSGNPGRGKTEAALSLAVQLAPSPLVDTWILDGGGGCDWGQFDGAAAGYVGDDLEAAEDMLRVLDALMCDRRRNLHAERGVRNGWHLGPAGDYRLQWLLVEEAPFYLDEAAVKGDRKREGHVRACRGLVAGLLRRGRAPMFHTSLLAQKGTGSAGLPPDLRDLCGLRWSFGVATTEAAAAILGDDIRKHETMSPTLLQGPEHVGVASALLRTGMSPYTLVKFPAIGQDRADAAAEALAARTLAVPHPEREEVPV